ncbi:unnamed protein product [Allacma fusca]|uniref:C2H2-type domain-containing protein n=1 Tax=Allacma fusca TaxID=39272 RepID=A0A8J2PU84_9HEXA|nr:unnamed protein product [Allacma fusca]
MPFCQRCVIKAEKIVKLTRKLKLLQEELTEIDLWVKSQIIKISGDSSKSMRKKWACEDPRVQTIRDLIVGPSINLTRHTSVRLPEVRTLEPHFLDDYGYDHEVKYTDVIDVKEEKTWDGIPSLKEESADDLDDYSGGSDFELPDVSSTSDEEKEPRVRQSRKKKKVETGDKSEPDRVVFKTVRIGEDKYLYGEKLEYTGNVKDGFKCSQCTDGHVYPKKRHIASHLRIHMRVPGVYKCHICAKDLSTAWALKYHMESHDDSCVVICEVCGKACKGVQALKYHHSAVHKQDAIMYECEVCGKAFKTKALSRSHKKQVHLKIKNYFCELCGRGFYGLNALKRHHGTNAHSSEKPFSCDECGQRFNTEAHRGRHIKQFHTPSIGSPINEEEAVGDPNLRCTYCGLQYNRQNNLTRHLLQIHHINVKGLAWKTKAPTKILEKVTKFD